MNDDDILMRGGTQGDIEKYSRMNGADLSPSNPFIEETVKEFCEKWQSAATHPNSNGLLNWLRSKLNLALGKGERKGRIDEADKCEEHIKVAREEGEAAGRKAAVGYIKERMDPNLISTVDWSGALQASNG